MLIRRSSGSDSMLVAVAYDVSTKDAAGRRRLRRIAKVCQDYGQRVQNSVFELDVDWGLYLSVRDKLLSIMDSESDSLRIYRLGNNWRNRVEHYGSKLSYDPEGFDFV